MTLPGVRIYVERGVNGRSRAHIMVDGLCVAQASAMGIDACVRGAVEEFRARRADCSDYGR